MHSGSRTEKARADRPKEHVFLTKNDEPLVEYESTLSGYGRQVEMKEALICQHYVHMMHDAFAHIGTREGM